MLPDRVTVLSCIACGAMGRQEGCDVACTEHKLVLVRAADYDELLRAGQAARQLAAVARRFADADAQPSDPRDALLTLRADARRALLEAQAAGDGADWAAPADVTGWWCERCGNVDLPQPCLGVCIWRPADWVNVALYERELALAATALRAAPSLRRFVARAAAVTPREGQWQRNWTALQAQARAALEG